MTFELLVLPNLDTMRPKVLEKIQQLVQQGGKIYGPKPQSSPSLEGFYTTGKTADQRVNEIANSLWQNIDGKQITQVNYGKGQVFYQQATATNAAELSNVLAQILDSSGVPADLSGLPKEVLWSHRSSDTHDIFCC